MKLRLSFLAGTWILIALVAGGARPAQAESNDEPFPDATLHITQPETGSVFHAQASIAIEATAIDHGGYISRVEFFAGEERVGVSELYFFRAPDPGTPIHHRFRWKNVPAGEYTLQARAIGSSGQPVESAPVEITVRAESDLPIVRIEASDPEAIEGHGPEGQADSAKFTVIREGRTNLPLLVQYRVGGTADNGADYHKLSGILILPENAEKEEIELRPFADDQPEGEESVIIRLKPGLCFDDLPILLPAPACYRLGEPAEAKAVIRDRSEVENHPPEVHFVHPDPGAVFHGPTDIELVASAHDPDGRVVEVEFFQNGQSLGIAPIPEPEEHSDPNIPYSLLWEDVPPGEYRLEAKATDNVGGTATSDPVEIRVTEEEPVATIRITSPADGEHFSAPAIINIRAEAVDPEGEIRRVVFFANEDQIGVSEVSFLRPPQPGEPVFHWFQWEDVPAGEYELTARGEDSAGNEIVSEPVHVVVGGPVRPLIVRRILPPAYTEGEPLSVRLQVTVEDEIHAYAVEDRPPSEWTVGEISHEGVFDPQNGKVKFGPFFDGENRELTYQLIPPDVGIGPQEFEGRASADGRNQEIFGDRVIEHGVAQHPADRAREDFRLTIGELTAYGAAWQEEDEWPVGPNPIPLSYVTRASFLWQHGEYYEFDPEAGPAPFWWVPAQAQPEPMLTTAALSTSGSGSGAALSATGNRAVRHMPATYAPGETLIVTIKVTPEPGVVAYAVEEQPPAGWTVAQISHNGNRIPFSPIRWGPFFDDEPRTLTYQLTPPSAAGSSVLLIGSASFDGSQDPVGGRQQISPAEATVAPEIIGIQRLENGQIELTISGSTAQSYRIQSSTDLKSWQELGSVESDEMPVLFLDPDAGDHETRYYRVRSP